LQDGQQPFIVGEYWAKDGRYIKEWVDNVAQGGADVHVFDFPLKFILTEMCDKSGDEFDMSRLAHAGMIRGFALPAKNVVTFVDNHDTGKEHDKWLVKDYAMAYAYILTHEGTPCLFYPHFYAVTQHDVDNPSLEVTAPLDLQLAIRKLIDIRRQYLGGTLAVLTESDKHLYVARRQGNGKKDGAIIVLNNHDTDTLSITLNVNPDGFTDWSGQTLVNLCNPEEKIIVMHNGQATLSGPSRGYSIWVLQKEAYSSAISFPQPIFR
jgi:alpha-amylase